MPVARVVQLATHLEQKRLADIAYETRRFVRIGESDVVINQRIADKSQPIIKIYHYHCNHLGTPQELSDDKGDIIWLSYDRAWGGNFDSLYKQQFVDNFAVSENELQPFKFQGQTLDIETGLHYNRFRYYDSDVGMFVSRDPISLEGGLNVFQYAPNPILWIDPLGLARTRKRKGPQANHTPCCTCKTGLVYRVMRNDQDISNGITAKDPTADYSEEGHVLHASKENTKTQYISVSKTLAQAINNRKEYGTPDQKIVQIDLSKVKGSVIDLNSECSPLKGITAINRARASGELLITGHIPADAITKLPY